MIDFEIPDRVYLGRQCIDFEIPDGVYLARQCIDFEIPDEFILHANASTLRYLKRQKRVVSTKLDINVVLLLFL
jgi:hypothetical protein